MADPILSQPELRTARLRLRALRLADAALIALYARDPRVARMTASIPHPYPPGAAEALIARVTAPGSPEAVWGLDAGSDGENGLIGLIALKARGEEAEIGYWVAPAFWNTGYAGEAVEAIKAQATARGLKALVASVFQDNLASARVLARAGFERVGEGEAYSLARGAMVPVFRYRLALEGQR